MRPRRARSYARRSPSGWRRCGRVSSYPRLVETVNRGAVTYLVRFQEDGSVGDVAIVHDTVNSPGLNKCAKARIQRWRLRAAVGVDSAQFTVVYVP